MNMVYLIIVDSVASNCSLVNLDKDALRPRGHPHNKLYNVSWQKAIWRLKHYHKIFKLSLQNVLFLGTIPTAVKHSVKFFTAAILNKESFALSILYYSK